MIHLLALKVFCIFFKLHSPTPALECKLCAGKDLCADMVQPLTCAKHFVGARERLLNER